ncbi:MAG: preprotein translocase subunit SecG [Gemmatimonadaceae bacterium]
MLYTFLIVLLVIDCLVLIAAVLLQSGKGGGLAASFGGVSSTSELFGSRQAGNLLTKASWWTGGIFLFLSFVLSLMSARTRTPRSVLDEAFTPPPAGAPATPNAAPAPSAVPLEPAPGAQPPAQTPAPAPQP